MFLLLPPPEHVHDACILRNSTPMKQKMYTESYNAVYIQKIQFYYYMYQEFVCERCVQSVFVNVEYKKSADPGYFFVALATGGVQLCMCMNDYDVGPGLYLFEICQQGSKNVNYA